MQRVNRRRRRDVPHQPVGRFTDEDRARSGSLLEPGRDIDRISGDERLPLLESPAMTSPVFTPVRVTILTPQ